MRGEREGKIERKKARDEREEREEGIEREKAGDEREGGREIDR